MLPWQPNTQKS